MADGKIEKNLSLKKKRLRKKYENKCVAEISRRYGFGSVEWQDAMVEHVKNKLKKGEPLDVIEKVFIEIQHGHNKNMEDER